MKTISRYIMTLALLITAATGAWAQEEYESFDLSSANTNINGTHFTITGTSGMNSYGLFLSGESVTVTSLNGENITRVEFIIGLGKSKAENITGTPGTNSCTNGNENGSITDINATSVTLSTENTGNTSVSIKQITVYYGNSEPAAPDVEVTTNAASEGATFTEASFAMPAYDATATYELVRDITQKVDVEVRIDGAATERVRIAKDGDGHYKFVTKQENGWQFAAVDKLDNNKDLTNGELTYTFKIKEGNDYVAKNFDTDLCPGTWRLEATANAEKPYEGIAYSKDIVLYDGYEITVAAGEYATFYKDENLYTEDEDAELYTIASVTDTEAVLSSAIETAPSLTPLLIFNKGTEANTFLLIPTTEQADEVTVAKEFMGSLTEGEIPASSAVADYYALNGKAFVWVKYAIEIGANKCWLQIGDQPAAARAMTRSIVGGGDTTNMDDVRWQMEDGNYYDLQGRKVAKPTRGGIYIHNGKKVILK